MNMKFLAVVIPPADIYQVLSQDMISNLVPMMMTNTVYLDSGPVALQ